MFSPQLNGNAAANPTRSSRRRQRPHSNEGSIAQPKAKRQRSALSEHTFLAPNGEAAPEMEEGKGKIATVARQESVKDIAAHAPRREIAVRGKKGKVAERTSRGDGSVVLVCDQCVSLNSKAAANALMLNRQPTIRTLSASFQHCRIDFEQMLQQASKVLYTQIPDML